MRTISDMSTPGRSTSGRSTSGQGTVALAATEGMLHFELGLAYEVFGADLSGVAEPWYDVAVCGSGRSGWAGSSSSRTAGWTSWPAPGR